MEKVIIIVDDEEEFAQNLTFELKDLRPQWLVKAYTSGLDALQEILQGGVDIVVTDIAMPDMDGYELFWRIKDHDNTLPVIMMTGFGYDPGHVLVRS
ncbi:MAG: response regulator, partial [Candidatus Cloacimonetes bacterium]|nr:response regulator [Candidatus Cloacimonadota bacterium]